MAHTRERRIALACALLVVVLAVYSYPSFKARAELGSSALPPIFAPDLTLYLNLSHLMPNSEGQVLNPYYQIPVPQNGAGYLKFGLAARLFGKLDRMLDGRTWLALLMWNTFWWGCLCITAICMFERYLPVGSEVFVILGVCLLMFFNFGVAKTVILAWTHLPSPAAFDGLGLPFIRAFIPVIPCALLLAYLGLQMEVLRRRRIVLWVVMALMQLLALAVFPYATLLMAGITAVSIAAQPIRVTVVETWRIPLIYALTCALLDCGFLLYGSVGFYENNSPAIHLQPQVLSHLIGGNWLLLLGSTTAVAFTKRLAPEVKWPLVGLGASNALLMLGDAVVPATKILLSHHAGYFVHTTVAILITFLAATVFGPWLNTRSWTARGVIALVLLLILVNGVLMVSGTYRGLLDTNRDAVQLSDLQRSLNSNNQDLVIARSKDVDDACGWIPLFSTSPVLFCTDAEVMLTPQQNRDIHRFRQALYLYFIGEDSDALQRKLSVPDPALLMYRLGYWAEAVSTSAEERQQGVRQIQTDLIPVLHKVEKRDAAVSAFFRDYTRIIVIDKQRDRSFDPDRLGSFLELEGQQDFKDFVVFFYRPR
jgi:hypothetical protein